jgi:hypothetical protein
VQIKEEDENLRYLSKYKLDKTLPKLIKKLNGKKVIIYGEGTLFQLIKKYYDISDLNIIGIADKKFETSTENINENGYKIYRLNEIKTSGADYILVTQKFYVNILEGLYEQFKDTSIKIKPLVKKPFWTIMKEL